MTTLRRLLMVAVVGAGAVFFNFTPARTQEAKPNEAPDGVEVLARGPVNEAFAEPVIRAPRASPVVPKQPPPPIEEMPPDQKPEGDSVKWISGYWAWDEDRTDFLWVSGIWRALPPSREWIPGHWNEMQGGWQWVAGYWHNVEQQKEVVYLPEPPDPVVEAVSPQPSPDSVYVPGCWTYYETRYLWRPGSWILGRPDWIWVPAHYVWTPAGFIFVDGYWDFSLRRRGLLFAPVIVDARFYGRPGWFYRPTYVISDDFLMGAMFVRLDTAHYYFGDYFDARYGRLGFHAWVDFRMGRSFPDPLFSYYRWENRGRPGWERDLRGVYVNRRDNEAARPPRTLVQQTTIINNIQNTTINNTTKTTNIKNVTVLTPLAKADPNRVKLQPVTQANLVEEKKAAQHFQNLSTERAKLEGQVAAKGSPATSSTAKPVKMELPGLKLATPPPNTVQAPPHPIPAHVTKPVISGDTTKTTQPGIGKPDDKKPGVITPDAKLLPKPGTKSADDKKSGKEIDSKPMLPMNPKPPDKPAATIKLPMQPDSKPVNPPKVLDVPAKPPVHQETKPVNPPKVLDVPAKPPVHQETKPAPPPMTIKPAPPPPPPPTNKPAPPPPKPDPKNPPPSKKDPKDPKDPSK
jgi:hypothetical protein